MASVKCFQCGKVNSSENITCEACGEKLLKGQEYEEKLKELKDYEEYRKRYSILGIILLILLLLLLYPVVKWLFQLIFSLVGTVFLPAIILEYAAPVIILLVFLIVVLPLIIGRWKIWCRYRWTRDRIRVLKSEIKVLPKYFFRTTITGEDRTNVPVSKIQGPPVILLVIVFTLVGLVYANKYTDFKPLDSITSLFSIEKAQTVKGKYDCHVKAADLGGGVMRSEQTWSYVFHSDGTYTSYLEGYQQYSGTWSQSGNILTVNVPAIINISAAYSFQATVSRDGNSFTSGERKFIKVK